MGNAINQDARALWISLRNDGGWWTAHRLTQHWSPTFAEFEVENYLQALHAGGFVAQRSDLVPRQASYAVTSECNVLPGLLAPSEQQQMEES